MPRPRFFNLPPRERAKVLSVASKHFAKDGFERASLNEILAEAGISKGAYYYYFDDKDDLLATVLEDSFERMFATLPAPDVANVTAETFWPTVERTVEAWIAHFAGSSREVMKAAMVVTESQRRTPRFAPLLEKAASMYRSVVEAGQRVGCIRTDLPASVLVRLLEANDAVLDATFAAAHPTMERSAIEAHGRLVLDTFKRLLHAAPPDTTKRPRRRPAPRGRRA